MEEYENVAQGHRAVGKNGIIIQVFQLADRIPPSTPQGGMRTENGQEDQDGAVAIKLQETTWKRGPALSLHCSQHTAVLGGLEWMGQRLGLGC